MALPVEDNEVFEEVDPVVSGIRSEQLFDNCCVSNLGFGFLVLAAEAFHHVWVGNGVLLRVCSLGLSRVLVVISSRYF